jgi:hypothetical protein
MKKKVVNKTTAMIALQLNCQTNVNTIKMQLKESH